jgi:hypothetical protein
MVNNNGWIKLHRQILEWEWYSDNNCFRVFLHLILKANHKEKRYKGIELNSGQIITSRDILAKETGLSSQQIRTALNKLISTNEITSVTSSQGTILQVVNYEKYQLSTNEITNEQPTSNQRATTNNKEKNNKENIYRSFEHLRISVGDFNKLCVNYTKEQVNDILDAIENYKDNKKFKSLYLTAKKWLKKNEPLPAHKINYDDLDPLVKKAIELGYEKDPRKC